MTDEYPQKSQDLSFSGPFNPDEVLSLIWDFLKSKGYTKRDRRYERKNRESGLTIELFNLPEKKLTVNEKIYFELAISMVHCKPGPDLPKNHLIGTCSIYARGVLETDFTSNMLNAGPNMNLFRFISDIFVFKDVRHAQGQIINDDLEQLFDLLATYFHMNQDISLSVSGQSPTHHPSSEIVTESNTP
jgi:hypothetical protein